MPQPRVAIAHDYLTQRGGAERVVLALSRAFPEATIYTTLYNPDTTYPDFRDARIVTSWLNRVPLFRRDHRLAMPLLAAASNSLSIDADVVIASSSGWAHGFPTTGRKLVYCHTPARYLYLSDEYLGRPARSSLQGLGLLALRPWLIRWDRRAAASADGYLSNSRVVQQRIRSVYGIDAEVLPPPHGLDADGPQEAPAQLADWESSGYFLVVSRLLPYKNVQQVIEAFRGLPDQRLVVVGRGPMAEELRSQAPVTVRLAQDLSDGELRWTYAHATALVAASYEDFGLAPLEAGAFGRPTLALRAGGFLDTVVEGVNGVFFDQATPDALSAAVRRVLDLDWDPSAIRAHTAQFAEPRFAARLRDVVTRMTA